MEDDCWFPGRVPRGALVVWQVSGVLTCTHMVDCESTIRNCWQRVFLLSLRLRGGETVFARPAIHWKPVGL